MKQIIASAFLSIVCFCTQAQTAQRTMDTKIEEVTVFLQGAQVYRTGKVQLAAGKNEILVKKLSPDMDPNSVVVKGQGNFTVLGVENHINYLDIDADSTAFENLKKKQEDLQTKIARETSSYNLLNTELTNLGAAMTLKNTQTVQKSLDVKDLLDFYRLRSNEIADKMDAITKHKADLQKELDRVANQIHNSEFGVKQAKTEVMITVQSSTAQEADFLVSYIVTQAGWFPEYDIRVTDTNSPLKLKTKARVHQSSSESWKEVNLTLSTGTPNKSGTKPTLPVYYLNVASGYMSEYGAVSNSGLTLKDVGYSEYSSGQVQKESAVSIKQASKKAYQSTTQSLEVSRVEGVTNASFEIKTPYSIPSDGKNYMVEIGDTDVPAEYEYQTVPKLDKEAFLVARITDWDKYDLMRGDANIFFEGTYTGKTLLNPATPGDTLEVSLGRDKGIVIKREKVRDFSKNKVLGSDKTVERRFEIAIRSIKKQTVNVVLEDQIPVSQNADITLEPLELGNATLEPETGKLTWKLSLEPAKDQKLKFGYKLKYPKHLQIRLE